MVRPGTPWPGAAGYSANAVLLSGGTLVPAWPALANCAAVDAPFKKTPSGRGWDGFEMVPLPPGEAVDRLIICQLKVRHSEGEAAERWLAYARLLEGPAERVLRDLRDLGLGRLRDELATWNEAMWALEDEVRALGEGQSDEGLARRIAAANDARCAVKRAMDVALRAACPDAKIYSSSSGPEVQGALHAT